MQCALCLSLFFNEIRASFHILLLPRVTEKPSSLGGRSTLYTDIRGAMPAFAYPLIHLAVIDGVDFGLQRL